MDILKKIENLRKQKNWSIYKLSLEAGLTQSTLSNMFARETLPSIQTLKSICDAFGITLSQFFSDGCEEYSLTEKEKKLIENYRLLSDKNKSAVSNLCNDLI